MVWNELDFVVAGGGMVGASAAVALTRQGRRVAMVERSAPPDAHMPADRQLRVSALSWTNIRWLQTQGIWAHVDKNRLGIYRHMRVWDARSGRQLQFSADFSRQPALGVIIENQNLRQAAWQCLTDGGVEVLVPDCIDKLDMERASRGRRAQIKTRANGVLSTHRVLAADGSASATRQLAGIEVSAFSYGQKGIVTYVTLEGVPEETAMQAFAPGGPVGMLPAGKPGLFSIVWSVPDAQVEALLHCADDVFGQRLEEAINHPSLGFSLKVIASHPRAVFPLRKQLAATFVSGPVVLAGDAAHVVHPLAGQGVNLGLQDIAALVREMQGISWRHADEVALALRRYARQRLSQAKEAAELMSLINHVFRDDAHIKSPVRNLALQAVQSLSPLKHWLMRQAGS